MRNALIESRLTPNAISMTGLVLSVVAAVLVWQELLLPRRAWRSSSARSATRSTGATRGCRARARRSARSSTRRSTASRRASCSTAVGRTLRQGRAGRRGRRRCVIARARVADGQLHARPRRGARRRVQGRHRAAARCASSILSIGLLFADGARLGDFELLAAVGLRARRAGHHHRAAADPPCAPRAERGRASARPVTAAPGGVYPPTDFPEGNRLREHQRQRRGGEGRCDERQGALPARQGPRRDHRRRQLRQRLRAGRRVLQERRPEAARSRASCTSTSAATTSTTSSSRAPSTSTTTKVGKDLGRGDLGRARTTRSSSPRCRRSSASTVYRGMTHDGLGKYLKRGHHQGPRRDRRHRLDPQGDAHRRRRLLPAGRLRGTRPSGTSSRSSRPAAAS